MSRFGSVVLALAIVRVDTIFIVGLLLLPLTTTDRVSANVIRFVSTNDDSRSCDGIRRTAFLVRMHTGSEDEVGSNCKSATFPSSSPSSSSSSSSITRSVDSSHQNKINQRRQDQHCFESGLVGLESESVGASAGAVVFSCPRRLAAGRACFFAGGKRVSDIGVIRTNWFRRWVVVTSIRLSGRRASREEGTRGRTPAAPSRFLESLFIRIVHLDRLPKQEGVGMGNCCRRGEYEGEEVGTLKNTKKTSFETVILTDIMEDLGEEAVVMKELEEKHKQRQHHHKQQKCEHNESRNGDHSSSSLRSADDIFHDALEHHMDSHDHDDAQSQAGYVDSPEDHGDGQDHHGSARVAGDKTPHSQSDIHKNIPFKVEESAKVSARAVVESLRGGSLANAKSPPPPPPSPPATHDNEVDDVMNEKKASDERLQQHASPTTKVPIRFLRAEKGDAEAGRKRYEQTLEWRRTYGMDQILFEPHPHFTIIKQNWPHYFHLRGKKNEPVYYEMPPKMNIQALRAGGLTVDDLLRHYALVTEFMWQYVERSEESKSIYIIDLEGMGVWDFMGEVVDFCKRASQFTQAHYPERMGHMMVINVPSFFKIVWNIMKPLADPVTLEKISVLRGKEEVYNALRERIPEENIPPKYGGKSVPLGQSPEEKLLRDLMEHNNKMVHGGGDVRGGGENGDTFRCSGAHGQPPCQFCTFKPVPLGGNEFHSSTKSTEA